MKRIALLLLLASTAIRANEFPIVVVGFSPDGKYAAYIEYGSSVENGAPYATLKVIQVATTRPAAPDVTVTLDPSDDKSTDEVAIARARKKAQEVKSKLGVKEWVPAKAAKRDDDGLVHAKDDSAIAYVRLETKKATPKQGARKCDDEFASLLVDVTVSPIGGADEDPDVKLYSENKVPKGRGCVIDCGLEQVWGHGTAVLAFGKCTAMGVEEPETIIIPMSAKLPYSLVE